MRLLRRTLTELAISGGDRDRARGHGTVAAGPDGTDRQRDPHPPRAGIAALGPRREPDRQRPPHAGVELRAHRAELAAPTQPEPPCGRCIDRGDDHDRTRGGAPGRDAQPAGEHVGSPGRSGGRREREARRGRPRRRTGQRRRAGRGGGETGAAVAAVTWRWRGRRGGGGVAVAVAWPWRCAVAVAVLRWGVAVAVACRRWPWRWRSRSRWAWPWPWRWRSRWPWRSRSASPWRWPSAVGRGRRTVWADGDADVPDRDLAGGVADLQADRVGAGGGERRAAPGRPWRRRSRRRRRGPRCRGRWAMSVVSAPTTGVGSETENAATGGAPATITSRGDDGRAAGLVGCAHADRRAARARA